MANPSLADYDLLLLGAMQSGVMVSCLLFGMVTMQVYWYYKKYSQDRQLFKVLVTVVWFLELAHSICITHGIYVATITWFGQMRNEIPDSFMVSYYFSATSNAIVQAFYAYRVARGFAKPYLAILCWILTLFRFLSGVVITAMGGQWHMIAPASWSVIMIIGFLVEAAVDIIIASSLCYFLLKSRRSSIHPRTIRLMDRLVAVAIPTGLLTCILAIILAVTGLTMGKYDDLYLPLMFCQAKLYSNSMLASFNSRSFLREDLASPIYSVSTSFPIDQTSFEISTHDKP